MTTIDIDIPDDLFMKLALEAHKRQMTLNDLCVEILEERLVDELGAEEVEMHKRIDKRKRERIERTEQDTLEDELRNASKNVVVGGVTTETLSNYGRTFSKWDVEYHGDKTSTELIQDGFDDAEVEMDKPPHE